jgi:hypothetical protein
MDQASLDRLQELKEDYAALMQLEEHESLEGWERRAKVLADAVNDLHGILLREATRSGGSPSP